MYGNCIDVYECSVFIDIKKMISDTFEKEERSGCCRERSEPHDCNTSVKSHKTLLFDCLP